MIWYASEYITGSNLNIEYLAPIEEPQLRLVYWKTLVSGERTIKSE